MMHHRPRIHLSCGRFLVWEPRHIFLLRCKYRLVGSLLGPMPGKNRQAGECGAPLSLLFEEALLAVEEGFADAVDGRASPTTSGAGSQVSAPTVAIDGAQSTVRASDDEQAEDTARATDSPVTSTAGVASSAGHDAVAAPGEASAAESERAANDLRPWAQARGFRAVATVNADLAGAPCVPLAPAQLRLAGAGRLVHAQVFRELWRRGYFVTAGQTFGADYLCYPGAPLPAMAPVCLECHPTRTPRVWPPCAHDLIAGRSRRTRPLRRRRSDAMPRAPAHPRRPPRSAAAAARARGCLAHGGQREEDRRARRADRNSGRPLPRAARSAPEIARCVIFLAP